MSLPPLPLISLLPALQTMAFQQRHVPLLPQQFNKMQHMRAMQHSPHKPRWPQALPLLRGAQGPPRHQWIHTPVCPHQSLHAWSPPCNVLALAHPADVEGAAASLAARDAATRRRRRARAGYKMVDTESDSYTRRQGSGQSISTTTVSGRWRSCSSTASSRGRCTPTYNLRVMAVS